ncbi:MAG: GTP 3',8-cyclase MoaA [Burkholderiales bacterium]|nr:GTP 3',8-cyclase MoaA [Burkholderiales bacterium]
MNRVIPIMPAAGGAPGAAAASPARAPVPPSGALTDAFGRTLRDLRISVTDHCNFRCTYCMPKEVFGKDYVFLPHGQLLSFEEIARLASVFAAHGVRKFRLTGGEPLLRRNIERLIEMLARIPGVELTLTTNGSALAGHARALKMAGLRRVTVSLDSLDDETFRAMNDVDFPVARVLEGIEAAADAGLSPVKINMVVKRSLNRASILPMARRFHGTGHILRYIEFMDVGQTNGWRMDEVVPSREVVRLVDAQMPLEPVDANYPGEVAERWRYRDGGGEIGVISSVTQAFCRSCTRARISPEGKLYTCLFANHGTDFRALLRSGSSDEEISALLRQVWSARDDRYSELRTQATANLPKVEMSFIGG